MATQQERWDELEARWKAYEQRLTEGGGNGSLLGAAYMIARAGVSDIAGLVTELRAAREVSAKLDTILATTDALAALLDPAEMLAAWKRAGKVRMWGHVYRAWNPDGSLRCYHDDREGGCPVEHDWVAPTYWVLEDRP